MELTPVVSSNVKAVGHADDALVVEYHPHTRKDGTTPPNVYRYAPVAREFFDRLFEQGASVGRLVNGLRFDPAVKSEAVIKTDEF